MPHPTLPPACYTERHWFDLEREKLSGRYTAPTVGVLGDSEQCLAHFGRWYMQHLNGR
ncbi:MAG: hypothetical protein LBI92_02900 [Azoarcus sp.]|jgi:hypothetical protein|nr:hypothetical protein [Azoarcus sp.]